MSAKLLIWVIILVGLAGVLLWLQVGISRERVSELEQINSAGTAGHALIVYHPGLSDIQVELTTAFARGLSELDWRVDRTTTSSAAPEVLTDYDLLVLGVHTYWWSPDRPTTRYLKRLGDLDGKPMVALLSALGATDRSERLTRALIESVNGKVLAVHPFWVLKPNDENDSRPNREVAKEIAFNLAQTVAGQVP